MSRVLWIKELHNFLPRLESDEFECLSYRNTGDTAIYRKIWRELAMTLSIALDIIMDLCFFQLSSSIVVCYGPCIIHSDRVTFLNMGEWIFEVCVFLRSRPLLEQCLLSTFLSPQNYLRTEVSNLTSSGHSYIVLGSQHHSDWVICVDALRWKSST